MTVIFYWASASPEAREARSVEISYEFRGRMEVVLDGGEPILNAVKIEVIP